MKCLCVAGFGSVPQQFYSILTQAGMAAALPATGNPSVDIHSWHRQVNELLEGLPSKDGSYTPRLGRLWERMASEIFLANSKAPCWGWADGQSIHLLEFWQGFDPRLNFLLLFISAETLVASYLDQILPDDKGVEGLLEDWLKTSEALVHFGRANPQRCMMLDVERALASPQMTVKQISTKWALPLALPDRFQVSQFASPSPVARLVANRLLQQFPSVVALQEEITSQVGGGSPAEGETVEAGELVKSFKLLSDKSKELSRISLLEEQCKRLDQLHQRTLSSYQQQYQEFQTKDERYADELRSLKTQLALAQANYESELASLGKKLRILGDAEAKKDQALKLLEERLSISVEENELLLAYMHQAQEELERHLAYRESLMTEARDVRERLDTKELELKKLEQKLAAAELQVAKLAEASSILERKLKESTEEGELLLDQLHQTQEHFEILLRQTEKERNEAEKKIALLVQKLDSLTLELQAKDETIKKQEQDLKQVSRDKAEQSKALSELRGGVEKKAKALQEKALYADQMVAKHEASIAELREKARQFLELQRKHDLLLVEKKEGARIVSQLRDRIEALEAERNREQEKIAVAQKEIARLAQENVQLESTLKHQENEWTSQARTLKRLEVEVRQAEEENEILLFQLHQLQEELERFITINHALENKNAKLLDRLGQFRKRNPDYLEFDSIEVVEESAQQLNWRLSSVVLNGEEFSELRFLTIVEHGMAGFVFARKEHASWEFLNRWPTSQEHLTLLPLGTPAQVIERSNALLGLSTRAWNRFLALVDFLLRLLKDQSNEIKVSSSFHVGYWVDALSSLKSDLNQFPSVPRFDQLSLKREQVNPDYEHLWFAFDNLCVAGETAPYFEFRVSCANVRPGFFGAFPKLEFPCEVSQSLIDSWFDESCDDFGPKLELRFALPESMDLGVWRKLREKDQEIIRSIVKHLPRWMRELENSGIELKRPWAEWQKMVAEIQRIMSQHATPAKRRKAISLGLTSDSAKSPAVSSEPSIQEAFGALNPRGKEASSSNESLETSANASETASAASRSRKRNSV